MTIAPKDFADDSLDAVSADRPGDFLGDRDAEATVARRGLAAVTRAHDKDEMRRVYPLAVPLYV